MFKRIYIIILILSIFIFSEAGSGTAESDNSDNLTPPNPTTESVTAQETQTPLSRGIELYYDGRYDEALTELNAEVNRNSHCPLAYYYAARIRLLKKQFPRARKNLLAAIRDSSDFADAVGVLAYTLKEMGNTEEALVEWRHFVNAVDSTALKGVVLAESIMFPEQYREKQKEQREAREKERKKLEEQRKEQQKLAARKKFLSSKTVQEDTLTLEQTPKTVLSVADSTAGITIENEIENQIGDLNQRIKSDIRKGIFGIFVAIVLLSAGIIGVVHWLRKRGIEKAELTFAEEVDHFIQEKVENKVDQKLKEELTFHEYREKRRILTGENEIIPGHPVSENNSTKESLKPSPAREPKQSNNQVSFEHFPDNTSGRQPITEEIKALVTRMHREGHTIEEICRAADLTTTEVELIIAVRTKRMEHLIEEISKEDEEITDSNHLYQAIRELKEEGQSPQMIAKKLDISTGEVHLALAVMAQEKNIH